MGRAVKHAEKMMVPNSNQIPGPKATDGGVNSCYLEKNGDLNQAEREYVSASWRAGAHTVAVNSCASHVHKSSILMVCAHVPACAPRATQARCMQWGYTIRATLHEMGHSNAHIFFCNFQM